MIPYRPTLLLLCLLLAAAQGLAQSVRQSGIVLQYNGREAKTPVAKARITVNRASPVVSDENGLFVLELGDMHMGDRILLQQAFKRGMKVFNEEEVAEWSIRKNDIRLVLCDATKFYDTKRRYMEIGENNARKKYEQQVNALKDSLAAHAIRPMRYDSIMQSLDQRYQTLLRNMDRYAERLARIDESEMDSTVNEALDLFHRGEIEPAIEKIESANLLEKLRKAVQERDEAHSEAETQSHIIEVVIPKMRTQITLYRSRGEELKARELEKAIEAYLHPDASQ